MMAQYNNKTIVNDKKSLWRKNSKKSNLKQA